MASTSQCQSGVPQLLVETAVTLVMFTNESLPPEPRSTTSCRSTSSGAASIIEAHHVQTWVSLKFRWVRFCVGWVCSILFLVGI